MLLLGWSTVQHCMKYRVPQQHYCCSHMDTLRILQILVFEKQFHWDRIDRVPHQENIFLVDKVYRCHMVLLNWVLNLEDIENIHKLRVLKKNFQ